MAEIFRLITPITYWILIILWSFILFFYVKRMWDSKTKKLFYTLVVILAIDAFRTLFESIYFGLWYTSLSGLIPEQIGYILTRPQLVIIPKILNVIAAVVVIVLLLKRWLPQEELEKERMGGALHDRENEFRAFFENIPVPSWLEDFSGLKKYFDTLREQGVTDIQGYLEKHPEIINEFLKYIKIIDVNQATLDLHGAESKQQLFEGLEKTFTPESFEVFRCELIDIWNGKTQATYDAPVKTLNNEIRYVTISFRVAPGHEEALDNVLVTLFDITEKTLAEQQKAQLENQLLQAQKMEAIGTLAGGIAHDFNNILSAVLGYAEMAKGDSKPGSTVAKDIQEVIDAGTRAKGLVRQILQFSRQADAELIPLQPVDVVKSVIRMLRPSLPSTIEIIDNIKPSSCYILADPTQIYQIIMNICTNAFHAMEDTGGKMQITVLEIALGSQDLLNEPGVSAGNFIKISVSDSGTGIEPSIIGKIFDPYFTTKAIGKGTGMGLAITHGIVKNYNGFISLASEPGEGTEIHIHLPVMEEKIEHKSKSKTPIPTGQERIFLIDDEKTLSEMGKEMLERLGYQVTTKNSSVEALELFQNCSDQFDLVITDQTMPEMTGVELSKQMIQIRPDIPILLCTGYSSIISEEQAKFFGIKEFILKPYSKKEIAVLIRNILDT